MPIRILKNVTTTELIRVDGELQSQAKLSIRAILPDSRPQSKLVKTVRTEY